MSPKELFLSIASSSLDPAFRPASIIDFKSLTNVENSNRNRPYRSSASSTMSYVSRNDLINNSKGTEIDTEKYQFVTLLKDFIGMPEYSADCAGAWMFPGDPLLILSYSEPFIMIKTLKNSNTSLNKNDTKITVLTNGYVEIYLETLIEKMNKEKERVERKIYPNRMAALEI